MWRAFRKTSPFFIMAVWDYVATVSVRWVANDNYSAVPIAGLVTLLWWLGVASVTKSKTAATLAIIGAMVGTYLGMRWP